jgi:hypothetical protein
MGGGKRANAGNVEGAPDQDERVCFSLLNDN